MDNGLFVRSVRTVVLDEADTMFDAGFGPEVRALLRPLRSKAQPAACVLVAATVSKVSPSLATVYGTVRTYQARHPVRWQIINYTTRSVGRH